MKIAIIGSGNVAAALGRKFIAAGHEILQIYGRNAAAASALAYEWNSESTNYTSLITKNADVYLIAVSDAAIADIAKDLALPGKIIVHTAAGLPKEILSHISENYGVFYPLQSLRKNQIELPQLSIFIESSNRYTQHILHELAVSISPGHVQVAGRDIRLKLHVAAVFANNFTNYLFSLAESFCKKENIDFKEMIPLIQNTIARLATESPSQMQTGPAIRKDWETINLHKKVLEKYPKHLAVYDFLTNEITRE